MRISAWPVFHSLTALFADLVLDQVDQCRGVESEIIEERGVLAEIIGVVEVVVGCEHIARNEDQAAAHLAAQGAAASDVDFFCKHSRIFL